MGQLIVWCASELLCCEYFKRAALNPNSFSTSQTDGIYANVIRMSWSICLLSAVKSLYTSEMRWVLTSVIGRANVQVRGNGFICNFISMSLMHQTA